MKAPTLILTSRENDSFSPSFACPILKIVNRQILLYIIHENNVWKLKTFVRMSELPPISSSQIDRVIRKHTFSL